MYVLTTRVDRRIDRNMGKEVATEAPDPDLLIIKLTGKTIISEYKRVDSLGNVVFTPLRKPGVRAGYAPKRHRKAAQ